MTKTINFLTVLIVAEVIMALIVERTMESVTIPPGFYIFSSFFALFTAGYRYYFEMDKKSWGASLMVLTTAGILFSIVLMFI
ncbi:hypothetical protein [Salimicrobium album]|uniref:Uncharacterized protein n=1 Tax=Salimicrobium album TaxID=50717 RepID=A0A1H3F6A8_9BACI|nr:hypothetical protein [Salimicrobium album]SDX86553.1 hypothetical protein SAMN04488081_1539 [Salimicrobium album]